VAQKIQGGLHFLEGPVWFGDLGALFFSDMDFSQQNPSPLNGPPATLYRLVPPGAPEVFIDNSSSNGLAIDAAGGLVAATHGTRSVSRIDLRTKAITVIADTYMGLRFNSPNDLAVRGDGNLYFSDPDWQLSPGTPSELPMAVYRVAPGGEVSVVDAMEKPNGVALSPDEGTLYVGAIDGKVRAYALDAAGAPGPAVDFADVLGPDGMGVDCAGDLYVAGSNGVDVFDPGGAKLGTITGTTSTTNVAFGGPDRRTLYITGGDSLYAIELMIPGYPY
jgi:gluconolactonase